MATAPAYTSSLIEALRNAVSDQGTPSGVVLLPNSKNVGGAINFVPRSRTGMTFEPPKPGPTGKPPVPPPSAPPVSPPAPVSPRGIEDLISIDPYGPQPRRIVTDDSDPYGPDVGPKRPDGGTDTDLATELGLTQQIDDFVGPQFLTGTTKTLTPNVTVNEVDVTDTPAPQTDPADDFEIDRELGIVQQSDLFDGNNKSSTAVLDGGNTIATAPNVTDVSLDPDNLGIYAYLLNDDVSSSLPAVVADTSEVPDRTPGSSGDTSPGLQELDNNRTGSTSQLSDQDLLELALFDLLSKQRLVGGGGPFETSVYREK